jgi:arginase
MPVSVAIGFGPDGWRDAVGGAGVAPSDAILLGPRDLEASLADGMRDPATVEGLRLRSNEDLRAEGPAWESRRAADALVATPGRYWLHLDVDVLDELVFPATDYLMPDGLSWDELLEVMTPLASTDAVIGASVACYNPEKDPGRACGRALIDALRSAFAG